MKQQQRIWPVILCGGAGTRLWPLSRSHYPKQLLALAGTRSLLQDTALRTADPAQFHPPVVICGEAQRYLVADQLAEAGIAPAVQWLEPSPHNTAPAIALAALGLASDDPQALMLVMPSDHLIADSDAFARAIAAGRAAAEDGQLVTFGLTPTRAETGFGYIEVDGAGEGGAVPIRAFVEKPDAARARQFLDGGRHYWNGGLFLMRADAFLAELERFAPDILASCRAAVAEATGDGGFRRPGPAFDTAPSVSIDYAVMERTDRASAVPGVEMGWTDVGSWQAVWDVSPHDQADNALTGAVIADHCHGSLIRAEPGGPLVAALGLDDLVVVSTRDAVLVCPRARSQEMRGLVDRVAQAGGDLTREQARVHRPWGTYETTDRGERFQTKRIVVKPGARLSLQMHHHRSEHWIVVRGTAEVTVGDDVRLVGENESTYIPAGTLHRLGNPGKIPLELIEVQCGAYLGEDDIVRFEDVYGR